ncbi:MAG: M23 family metallopeptidase [Chloroflexota bacterium]|nr:M23 family metallopeptidase [Anaerolineales bacterium]
MNEIQSLLRRYGGQLVLLLALLFLWIGWQVSRPEEGSEVDTAVSNPDAALVEVTPFVVDIDPGAPTPAVIFSPGELPQLVDDALSPEMVPLTYQGQLPEHTFETYVVERGDTPGGIAEKFGIKPETLLGGNASLSQESSLLQTGVELVILPIDGVLHDVAPGDTLESISALYAVPVEDIIAYEPNRLEFPYRLYPETQIMVPGAVREVFVWNPPTLESVGGTSWEGRNIRPLIVGSGVFIYPVGSRNFTQYYWYGHRAIDIGLVEGTAVYAADDGTVTYAAWNNYGYGNLIVVNHGNGFETFYAHLSSINAVPGQIVYKGNLIGLSGNTGNSSGPHIHFEIRLNGNQDDPCWYIGCG